VYSVDVGDEVGMRSHTCHIMCVEHVCTLYSYPICMYCAKIYKSMEFVVFVIGTLTKN